MFEELNAHRQAVQENIEKAFEIGFTGNEDLEKAHQVGDIHPNGKWVWTQLPSGKYDWRVIKNKQGDNSTKSSSSKQSVDISKIPDKEFKRITNMLEKQNPLEKDAPRHLEEEAMSDSELKNFLACAEHFKNDTKNINQLTRYRCSEWAKLAKSELDNRQQSKKAETKQETGGEDEKKKRWDESHIQKIQKLLKHQDVYKIRIAEESSKYVHFAVISFDPFRKKYKSRSYLYDKSTGKMTDSQLTSAAYDTSLQAERYAQFGRADVAKVFDRKTGETIMPWDDWSSPNEEKKDRE